MLLKREQEIDGVIPPVTLLIVLTNRLVRQGFSTEHKRPWAERYHREGASLYVGYMNRGLLPFLEFISPLNRSLFV